MQHPAISRDRRRFVRNPVKAHALVHCHGHFQSATVVDFSQGGLQLEGTFALFRGDEVEIEFLAGTRVSGTVTWSLGARTGITFSEPLPEMHPASLTLHETRTGSLIGHAIPIVNAGRSNSESGARP
jgi:hypothetical protein